MFMHDHTKRNEGGVYCPLMKEICVNGWTKSMGQDEKGMRPSCVRWRPVSVFKGVPPKQEEVWDCKDAWVPDLIVQNAQESYQVGAAVESARNIIAEQSTVLRNISLIFKAIAHKTGISRKDVATIIDQEKSIEQKNQKKEEA